MKSVSQGDETLPLIQYGAPLSKGRIAIILLHGRGASAHAMLPLAESLDMGEFSFLLPQAPGGTWYPQSFLAPVQHNQPFLDRALMTIERTVEKALSAGLHREQLALIGFSQGACLAAEFMVQSSFRLGALVAFTGGALRLESANVRPLEGMAALLTSSDPDPHVPLSRVKDTAELLRQRGAHVSLEITRGAPHAVLPTQIQSARDLLTTVASSHGRTL